MKILIVDDEKSICEEFRDILHDEGHDVQIALNGMEALEKVGREEFEVVFLDVLMPRMEGREVFEKIHAINKKVQVVIMSGFLPPNKERDILDLGALACLRKPLDLNQVRTLLKSVQSRQAV
ncbi:MAG: response regulator [Candidatus Omnitrophota bacterium]